MLSLTSVSQLIRLNTFILAKRCPVTCAFNLTQNRSFASKSKKNKKNKKGEKDDYLKEKPDEATLTSRKVTSKAPDRPAVPVIQYVKPGEAFEPHFEDTQQAPVYESAINIRLHGYDFQVLESFQSYIHKIAMKMGAHVNDSYASPAKNCRVDLYAPRTTTVVSSRDIAVYERVVELGAVSVTLLPLICQYISGNIPEGVTVTIKKDEKHDQEARYIPDFELLYLQQELRDLDNPHIRRRLGYD